MDFYYDKRKRYQKEFYQKQLLQEDGELLKKLLSIPPKDQREFWYSTRIYIKVLQRRHSKGKLFSHAQRARIKMFLCISEDVHILKYKSKQQERIEKGLVSEEQKIKPSDIFLQEQGFEEY